MECPREEASDEHISHIYVNCDEFSGEYKDRPIESYKPTRDHDNICKNFGHGGSDFYSMYHFIEKILGNPAADTIDVYEALDMFLPGMFAYRSILNGGKSMDIPNLRNQSEREKWRNDTACTDPNVAGDMLLPTSVNGTPDIDDTIYQAVKQKWMKDCASEDGYRNMAFNQSSEDTAK